MVEQCYKNNNIEVKGMLLNEENLLRKSIIMANELDVAGEFIYSAIIKLDKMQHFEQVADDFYFFISFSCRDRTCTKNFIVYCERCTGNRVKRISCQIKKS